MAGKTPTEPTVDQQRQFLAALMQKNISGELTPEQQEQFWTGLGTAHEGGITGGNSQLGKDLYQYTKSSMTDTGLPPELRQQLAQSYYLRQGTPYIDPMSLTTVPDTVGMGGDGGQRTPTNTGGSSGGPAWQGSPSHDEQGNIIPGGSADPDTVAYQPPSQPPTGGGSTTLPPTGGGSTTLPPTGGGSTTLPPTGGGSSVPPSGASGGSLYGPPMPFGGYEGPNAELYARQFGNLVGGNDAFQHNQLAAALRRESEGNQQGESAPWEADWDWANLPQVRTNAQQPGESQPYDWILNPAYNFTPGETTNADMIRGVMGNSGFSNSDRNWFNRFINEGGDMDSTFWSEQSRPQDILSQFDFAGDNRDRMEKAINLAFARQDLSTPQGGGPAAPPPGYAAPR